MTIIGKEAWPHRAHYDFFAPMSDPFYTLTPSVDMTPLWAWYRANAMPFYLVIMFAVTKIMEVVGAFHYRDRDGMVVRHDTPVPSFIGLKPNSGLFQVVTVETGEDAADFRHRAGTQTAAQTRFITSDP